MACATCSDPHLCISRGTLLESSLSDPLLFKAGSTLRIAQPRSKPALQSSNNDEPGPRIPGRGFYRMVTALQLCLAALWGFSQQCVSWWDRNLLRSVASCYIRGLLHQHSQLQCV